MFRPLILDLKKNEVREVKNLEELTEEITTKYRVDQQVLILAEECNELAKECLKATRNDFSNLKELTEEIADVQFLINQIKIYLNITEEELKEQMMFKANRTIERMEESK